MDIKPFKQKKIQFVLYDLVFILIIWLIPGFIFQKLNHPELFIIPLFFHFCVFYIEGSYERNSSWIDHSIFQTAAYHLLGLSIVFVISKYLIMLIHGNIFFHGRHYLIILFTQLLFIIYYKKFIKRIKDKYTYKEKILVIGTDEDYQDLVKWLDMFKINKNSLYIDKIIDIKNLETWDTVDHKKKSYDRRFCFGKIDDYDCIVTFESQEPDTREMRTLLNYASKHGLLSDFPNFCGYLELTYPIDHINSRWIIRNSSNLWLKFSLYLRLRILLDFILSLALLIITSPLLIITSVLVFTTSKGPIFFKQRRTGRLGKKFTLYKFRSMTANAESNGPQFAIQNDNRVTWIGGIIRKTRIDELPQLYNVLKGEMAFIGPRPEREHFENILKEQLPLLQFRTLVKPGITGLAQTRAPYANDLDSYRIKLGYDIFYIKNLSPLLDLSIILQTIRTVLFKKGH